MYKKREEWIINHMDDTDRDRWDEWDDWMEFYEKYSRIEGTDIYISGADGADNAQQLAEKNIRAIVSLGESLNDYPTHEGIDYLRIIIYDNPAANIKQYFQRTHDFISTHLKKGSAVLVHCRAGVSRSASIVISYLIKSLGLRYQEAFDRVYMSRPVIGPNDGFREQLKELEKDGLR